MLLLFVVSSVVTVVVIWRLARLDRSARRAQHRAWAQWRLTGRAVPGWGPEWVWSSDRPGARVTESADSAPAAVICLACHLEGRAASSTSEAQFLAGVHNELHHAARPVATIAARSLGTDQPGGAA
ncbi:hypothetical protein NUM3379_28550 [Kineococcus sp. NUM-3379]